MRRRVVSHRATGERQGRLAEIIAHDGRPFRDTALSTGTSRPPRDEGNPLLTSALQSGAAERYDMLLHPPTVGQYTVHFDWFHWVPGRTPNHSRRDRSR
jgi:hypothetical protein